VLKSDYIRKKSDKVRKAVVDRGFEEKLVDRWLELDKEWREQLTKIEKLRAKRNDLVEEYKEKGEKPPKEVIEKGRKLKEEISQLEENFKTLEADRREAQLAIPNIPASDVRYGKTEKDNVEIKVWGVKRDFEFKPKDHLEIGEKLGIIDVERAGKVSGARTGYFIGDGALMEMALIHFAVEEIKNHGFTFVIPPVLVKKEVERAMGYVEHGDWREMYETKEDGLVLVSSSEHSVIPRHKDETLSKDDLPVRYVNFSTCFRREAGSYGKDTRGMFRVHQFNKVEMNMYTLPDVQISDSMTQSLLKIQEELMQSLNLPYKITASCTGDLPFPNRRMYDLNTWFPGQDRYRETHSCSNCTDFQTRRLNIQVDLGGETEFVHALNATGITDRVLLAILENYQQEDGSIEIPDPLRDYMGKDLIA